MTIKAVTWRATAVGVGFAMSFLIVEAGLRLANYTYTPLRIEVINNWSEWRYHHAFEDERFEYDPLLIWRPRKGGEFANSQGFRGREIPSEKEAGSFRIFAIGDSNTLGWPGKDGPNWPAYLEKLDGRLTVINAGVYGYSSLQGLRRFEQSLDFHPDLVLISFGCNDAMRVTLSDADFMARKIRKNNLDMKLMQFRIGQLLLSLNDSFISSQKETLVPRVSVAEFKENLRQIVRIGHEADINVVLMTRPFTGESPSPTWWKNFAPDYNAATLEMGREMNVPVLDVYTEFTRRTDEFVDESHFTEAGLRRLAVMVYSEIRPYLDRWASSGQAAEESERPK